MRDYPLVDLDYAWHDAQVALAAMAMILGDLQADYDAQWPALQSLDSGLTLVRAMMATLFSADLVEAIAEEHADYEAACDRAAAHAANHHQG